MRAPTRSSAASASTSWCRLPRTARSRRPGAADRGRRLPGRPAGLPGQGVRHRRGKIGPVTQSLYQKLTDIQWGRAEDPMHMDREVD